MRFLRRTFDVHVGEGRRVALMWLYLFLVVAAMLVVKPAATSLFVSEFGAAGLPIAYVLVAVAAACTSILYLWLLVHARIDRLISGSLRVGIAVLLALWTIHFVFSLSGWLLYVFYVWVAIWAVTSASQFWTLANLVFNAREAKRLFSLVGTGGIVGGVVGGYSTIFLAPLVGTESLLLVSAALLACCLPIVRVVWGETIRPAANVTHHQQHAAPRRYRHGLRLLMESRHLGLVALLVGLAAIVAKLVDFQFAVLAGRAIGNEDELTAFFAFWLSTFNVVSLAVQLLATRRLIGLFGVARSLLLMPSAILAGSLTLFLAPGLAAAIGMRMADGSLKQSINKAGMEMLYLPVPARLKTQAKAFIDVFVDSAATGLGGLLLVVATLGFGLDTRGIAALTLVFVLAWIQVVRRVRREYLHLLRGQIENVRSTAAEDPDAGATTTVMALQRALQSNDEGQVLSALKLFPEPPLSQLIAPLAALADHAAASVRAAALRELTAIPRPDLSDKARRLLADADPRVRLEALAYLFERAADPMPFLSGYLENADPRLRCAGLICAAREARTNRAVRHALDIDGAIAGLLAEIPSIDDPEAVELVKMTTATAIGEANNPELYPYLHALLSDPSAKVRQAALAAAARSTSPDFVPAMVRALADESTRIAAVDALAGRGSEGLKALMDTYDDPPAGREERLAILAALGSFGTQEVVDRLFVILRAGDSAIRSEAARALNRLRRDYRMLHFDGQEVERTVLEEARAYLNMLTVLRGQLGTGDPGDEAEDGAQETARRRLIGLVEQRLDDDLERIFRLLALRYPQDAIHDAFVGLQPDQPQELRASAIEFLDNLLDPHLKRIIIPLLETTLAETLLESIPEGPSRRECMRTLLASRDAEIVRAVLELLEEMGPAAYAADIAALTGSRDSTVATAARRVLDRLVG